MEILNNEKDLKKELKGLSAKDIKSGSITITIYNGSGSSVKYDINAIIEKKTEGEEYNPEAFIYYYKEGARVGGGGYDRWSTALSNGLNLFKNIWKIKTTLKRRKTYNVKEYYTKDGRRVYGLYKDGSISYGIGTDGVLYAVKNGFSNLKLKSAHYGKKEDCFKFEIKGAK